MNEPTLTDTEREALNGVGLTDDPANGRELFAAVELVVAARVAEAVDRERAAWATKIETLAAEMDEGSENFLTRRSIGAAGVRALLAADDTAK